MFGEAFVIMSVFLGLAAMVAVPLAVLLGVPLLAWNLRALIRLRERELDLKRIELSSRLKDRYAGELPLFVDPQDPQSVLAWASAHRELRGH